MSSNGVELEQVIHTHSHSWPRGIGEPKSWSSLLNSYFRLSGFQSWLLFAHCCYGPNTLHTTPMCVTEHIRYVSLHCRDQRGAATLRYRNRAKIIIYYLWTEAPSGIYGCGIALEIPMILQDPRKPTSAETSLKKWICVPSIFIDIIPAHLLC